MTTTDEDTTTYLSDTTNTASLSVADVSATSNAHTSTAAVETSWNTSPQTTDGTLTVTSAGIHSCLVFVMTQSD